MLTAMLFPHEVARRKAFVLYPRGSASLGPQTYGADHVIIAAAFSVGISLDPPLVAFAVQRESTTWPQLCRAGMIGVSILAAGQGDLCRQLADKDKGKRWQGVDAGRTRAGAIFIRDAALSLECAVHAQYPAGDHEIILLEIATFIAAAESDPLVFQG